MALDRGARLTADFSGLDIVRRALERLEEQGRDPDELLDEIGAEIEDNTVERFETNKAPDGSDWLQSKRAKDQGGRTLVDQGHLRDSITRQVSGRSVHVGTNKVYAAIHQFGGKIEQKGRTQVLAFRARGGRFASRRSTAARRAGAVRVAFATIGARTLSMPARPYLGLSPQEEVEIPRIAERFIARALGGTA